MVSIGPSGFFVSRVNRYAPSLGMRVVKFAPAGESSFAALIVTAGYNDDPPKSMALKSSEPSLNS
jgi:hypothetical protein